MAPRKLLGRCPICGKPVWEDQDPGFEAERESEGRDVPAHAECAGEEADAIIEEMRRQLGFTDE